MEVLMHTVELLNEAIKAIRQIGYRVRQDWLDGEGGAACIIRGEKWVFLDISESYGEQLDSILNILHADSEHVTLSLSQELTNKIESQAGKKAA